MTDNDFNPVVEIQAEVQVTPTLELQAEVDMGSLASERNAEAWAVGQRGGVDVSSTDQTYHNNAKYWAEQAEQTVVGSIIDDTSTALNKTWSAHKVSEEFAETNGEVTDLKSAKAPIIIETISTPADVQTFPDGADGMLVKTLTVGIEPVQDLHGYDNPWPAGGGVNILDPNLKFATQTVRGVTLTTSNGYQFSVSGTGESGSGDIKTNTIATDDCVVYPAGTYTATGMILSTYHPDGSWYSNRGGTFTSPDDFIIRSGYREIAVGTTYNTNEFISLTKGSTALTEWSPYSNICPITGHTGANVSRTGVNVWDEEWRNGYYGNTGVFSSNANYVANKNQIPVQPNTNYYFTIFPTPQSQVGRDVFFYDANGEFISKSSYYNAEVVTTPNNCYFVNFNFGSAYGNVYKNDVSINYPATDTQYHPGHVQQIEYEFPQEAGTVYGGTLTIHQDGSGELVVDRANVDLGTLTWSGNQKFTATVSDTLKAVNGGTIPNWVCSSLKVATPNAVYANTVDYAVSYYSPSIIQARINDITDAATFETAMSGVQLVYELATPVSYTLTCPQVLSLLGTNNLWADTGEINAVEYPADTKLYIDKKLTELQALVLEN